MRELIPLPIATLLRRILRDAAAGGPVLDLPTARFWRGAADPSRNLGVRCCSHPAGSPLGPAAGPHTQMAQNIVLGWLGGCRIFELKTVQVNDRLVIPRPCIDMTNVGYNVEFSQELRVQQSLEEYVKAWMLLRMLEHAEILSVPARSADQRTDDGLRAPHFHDVVFDLSCGYDLAGLQTPVMRDFIGGLLDATPVIEKLRSELPDEFGALRDLDFDPCVSRSVTLSTFHNCPPSEIEGMALHLMREHGLHVVVKMNPTMLGRGRLNELLRENLGYTDVTVHDEAFDAGLQFDDAVSMMARVTAAGHELGLHTGAKFTNTLEVVNHRSFFPATEQVMYLSGAPLHPIAMELAWRFNEAFAKHQLGTGADQAPPTLSFSAGIDKHNFTDCVACGFVPVTVCTDLLKPGGYGRALDYLASLETAMIGTGAQTINEFIAHRADGQPNAAAINLAQTAAEAIADSRYSRARNAVVPPRIDSHLWLFDCITCDKCIPVCPNHANFTFEVPRGDIPYHNLSLKDGTLVPTDGGVLRITRLHQIANFAPFCNECGNCDTFCPEYGGPFIEKPTFYATEEQWREAAPRDGFWAGGVEPQTEMICGRIQGKDYTLRIRTNGAQPTLSFNCPAAILEIDPTKPEEPRLIEQRESDGGLIEVNIMLTLQLLLRGVLHSPRANYINSTVP
ncbi:glutamate synthase [candidate division BRC1 bacterium HGW-BRC1-1]|jgi:putative selenate reductase|nr:MAG: glutamate synthase [candidate division BRC1 bacterium HGW-BRC1-1]